jgi:hypothetical protein|tara:strand:+ start:7061 stop:9625 length:2565 start_codon:yes stop_codon:yes gene_type:complete
MQTVEGILNEPKTNFVGKDGFYWWVGEIEDNEDPMELGRVKVRVLGYYTNPRGGTVANLPTEQLPWATVLQHTSQAGNDAQGESSGQLQAGAIVMGFFMDGEDAQMPVVIGVLRVQKAVESGKEHTFAFTGENMEEPVINPALRPPAGANSNKFNNKSNPSGRNDVKIPGSKIQPEPAGPGSPNNIGVHISGSSGNPLKGRNPENPIPTANGVGGPWKSVEAKLSYLMEDIVDTSSTLVATDDTGNFIDIVSGKVVTLENLTRKLKNFMGAVFTQIVSGIRMSTANLSSGLGGLLGSILGSLFGSVPFAAKIQIQNAITSLLSSMCAIDGQIAGFIDAPMATINTLINNMLNGAISKLEMLTQGVQTVIDSIVCNVENVLADVKKVIATVKATTSTVAGAAEIIANWEKGDSVFEPGSDLMKNGLAGLTGLVALFSNFASGDSCDRKPSGGKAKNGFYPLFGVTSCTDAELANINKVRGGRGSCAGESAGTGVLDQIFSKADPYLQVATTFITGGYDHHIGTPGRQAHVIKEPSGTTHSSVNINNNTYAEYIYMKELKKSNPDLTPEEREAKLEAYKKTNRGNTKDDTGNLVADHSTYAGNHTIDVIGDECSNIDGDKVINVEGDYRLKITGDMHLEVGGGFFMDAVGAAKQVDKNGKDAEDKGKVQKHVIKFDSDLDMNVAGADFQLQASKILVGSKKYEGIIDDYSLKSDKQDFLATKEIIISADTAITHNTPNMFNNINQPVSDKADKPGIRTTCAGSIITNVIPASPHATVPPIITTNKDGPISTTCGSTGMDTEVLSGGHYVTVAGVSKHTVNKDSNGAGGDINISAKRNMTTDVVGTFRVTAKTIFLN